MGTTNLKNNQIIKKRLFGIFWIVRSLITKAKKYIYFFAFTGSKLPNQTPIEEINSSYGKKRGSKLEKCLFKQCFLKFSHYQVSDEQKKFNNFSIDHCFTSLKLLIETLMEEIKSVAMEKNKFQFADSTFLTSFFGVFGHSVIWRKEQNHRLSIEKVH